jgi:hypothetical protein
MMLALMLLVAAGCGPQEKPVAREPSTAVANPSRDGGGCIGEREALAAIVIHEEMIDLSEEGAARTTPLVAESSCHKKVFQRGKARIVVWQDEDGKQQSRSGVRAGPLPTPACLEDAASEARTLLPYAGTILARAKAKYGDRWSDPDLGAAAWIQCTEDQMVVPRSIITLLHELNHELSDGDCLHEPASGQAICFSFRSLPRRSIAKVDLGELDDLSRALLRPVQDNYLGVNDGELLSLLDELMAYRISTDAHTALIQKRGAPIDLARDRQVMYLAVFMFYTARYAVLVRAKDPSAYEANLGTGTENLARLLELLDLCEASYLAWERALAAAKQKPLSFEAAFWARYLDARRELTAPPKPAPGAPVDLEE